MQEELVLKKKDVISEKREYKKKTRCQLKLQINSPISNTNLYSFCSNYNDTHIVLQSDVLQPSFAKTICPKTC